MAHRTPERALAVAVLALISAACGGGDDADAPADAGPIRAITEPTTLTHRFPAIDVGPGEEIYPICQSWTLGNEEPLFVNAIRGINEGAWHHSNWVFVTDNLYRGEDGTWDCDSRRFDGITGGITGGVFFAQSTQAPIDEQRFPPGVAMRLPPHARVIGDVHLINATPEAKSTAMTFEVDVIPESQVTTRLLPLVFVYLDLTIPPRSQSQFVMDCPIAPEHRRQLGREPDFNVYYVLPHYHTKGNLLRLELVGGANDGQVLYESRAATGEPWGQTITPPIPVAGAESIRMTCGFDNPTDATITYGIGDQEMCVLLAFTDSRLRYGGTADATVPTGTAADGTATFESPCTLYAFPEL